MSVYEDLGSYWAAVLREPLSVYDFSDALAVHRASSEGIRSECAISALRLEVYHALHAAASASASWLMGDRTPLLDNRCMARESWNSLDMMKIDLMPWEAAVWLLYNPNAAFLVPASLRRYLLATERAARSSTPSPPVVTDSELSAFLAQPDIAVLKRHQQRQAVREHFHPRWVPDLRFRKVAAMNPRSPGRY